MDKQNFEEWEAEQEEYERLFHKGKLLHAEINALDADDILITVEIVHYNVRNETTAVPLTFTVAPIARKIPVDQWVGRLSYTRPGATPL